MREPKYINCPACGERAICTQQDVYPDAGWVLPFETFGYYGGFDDCMPVLFGTERSGEFVMCHDCVVKFLETFPRLAERVGANTHPCSDEVPCCRHAWQATELFGKNVFGVQTRTAWPDGQWHDDEPTNPYG